MSSQGRNVRTRILFLISGSLIVAGTTSIGLYAFEAWSVAGSADQSMAFWMLPFLLGGLLLIGLGAVLLVFWRLLVNEGNERRPETGDHGGS